MKNLAEFKKLIERYREITLEDIEESFAIGNHHYPRGIDMETIANLLTGFGSVGTCSLCLPINGVCKKCAWGPRKWGCMKHDTYKYIDNIAKTPSELLDAFKKRSDYMEEYLKIKSEETYAKSN